jgi:hypothetical protein
MEIGIAGQILEGLRQRKRVSAGISCNWPKKQEILVYFADFKANQA